MIASAYSFHLRVSGQGVYQTANELFFTARCVIVLVFDLEKTTATNDLKARVTDCVDFSL